MSFGFGGRGTGGRGAFRAGSSVPSRLPKPLPATKVASGMPRTAPGDPASRRTPIDVDMFEEPQFAGSSSASSSKRPYSAAFKQSGSNKYRSSNDTSFFSSDEDVPSGRQAAKRQKSESVAPSVSGSDFSQIQRPQHKLRTKKASSSGTSYSRGTTMELDDSYATPPPPSRSSSVATSFSTRGSARGGGTTRSNLRPNAGIIQRHEILSEEDNNSLPDYDEQSEDERPRLRASVVPTSSRQRMQFPEAEVKPLRKNFIDLTRSSDSPEPERFVPTTTPTMHHFGSSKMDALDFIYQVPVDVKPRITGLRRAAVATAADSDSEGEDSTWQIEDGTGTEQDEEPEIEEIDDIATPPPDSDSEEQKRAKEGLRQKRLGHRTAGLTAQTYGAASESRVKREAKIEEEEPINLLEDHGGRLRRLGLEPLDATKLSYLHDRMNLQEIRALDSFDPQVGLQMAWRRFIFEHRNDFLRDAPKTIRNFIEEYKHAVAVTAGDHKELIALLNWFRCHQFIQSRDLVDILREWRELVAAAAMLSDGHPSPSADGQRSSTDGSD